MLNEVGPWEAKAAATRGAEMSLHHPAGDQHWLGMILNRVKRDLFQLGDAQGDSV